MRKISVGKNVVYLVNDLASLTVGAFTEHMAIEAKLDGIKAQRAELETQLLQTVDPRELLVIDAALLELDHEVVKAKVLQLANLGADDKTRHLLRHLLLNTEGITLRELGRIGDVIAADMGQFTDFFHAVKPLESFEFGRKKGGVLNRLLPTAQVYKVRDMRTNTVLQDTAAVSIARRVDGMAEAMKGNDWTALADFVAMVARPSTEEREVDKALAGLNPSEKLDRYNEKLTEVLNTRAKAFKDLPLGVALGVYKQYFFFGTR